MPGCALRVYYTLSTLFPVNVKHNTSAGRHSTRSLARANSQGLREADELKWKPAFFVLWVGSRLITNHLTGFLKACEKYRYETRFIPVCSQDIFLF